MESRKSVFVCCPNMEREGGDPWREAEGRGGGQSDKVSGAAVCREIIDAAAARPPPALLNKAEP